MKEEFSVNQTEREPQEEEIDLLELARKLWNARKRIAKWAAIGAAVGIVVAFSIPKEYSATVKLAPELSSSKKSLGGLSDLASLAGVNVGGAMSEDAMSPTLYPDIVESIPFMVALFDVPVTDRKGDLQTTVYDYVQEHTRRTWWSAAIMAPFKFIGWTLSLFKEKEDKEKRPVVDPFRLTRKEHEAVKKLSERVVCTVDKKTSVISLTVTMQDPLIAATLTDTVMVNLQNHITDYRTNKARHDLDFTQKLYDESQAAYYAAQARYARYMDANQNVVLRSVRTEQERLQNEMNLNYEVYNQTAQQLQLAKAKVQESTPVYVVLQPATVPLRAEKPAKMLIIIGFAFLFGAAVSAWVLFGEELAAQFKKEQ
ncbi:MAG: Wzz/FepE/Etk N-terminal domain-containing protein [Alistipes senegalensis]|nr:Wzz/FepE/Etk N-terminal domain-containing protein [Bacteroides cellulosilyticus]MCM1352536.1 Wzz/FepE/Etk N-terminal domain-containing protein [Alistipes senegalensis]